GRAGGGGRRGGGVGGAPGLRGRVAGAGGGGGPYRGPPRSAVHSRLVNVDEFDYDLPRELIAQAPAETRDASRLLVLRRATGAVEDRAFADLPGLLRAGDCLVVNDSRVIPARVLAEDDAGRPVELLFV